MSLWMTRQPNRILEGSPVQKLFNQMLEDVWDNRPGLTSLQDKPLAGFTPRVNLKETENSVQVTAELPGLDEKDIDITVDKLALTISGEKKEEQKKDDKGSHYYECTYGSFIRKIPLPFEVNMEKVEANFKRGVLSIHLEKAETAKTQTRKIPIQTRN